MLEMNKSLDAIETPKYHREMNIKEFSNIDIYSIDMFNRKAYKSALS